MPSSDYALITAIRYDPALLSCQWNTQANQGVPSSFMLLRYHFDRLINAAIVHGWADTAAALTREAFERECQRAVDQYTGHGRGGPLKLRPELARSCTFIIPVTPVPALRADPMLASSISSLTDALPPSLDPPLPLYLDTQPTPSSVFTATKTTRRAHYAAARARLGLAVYPSPDPPNPQVDGTSGADGDVLLYNEAGMLTETSIRNVALFRRGRWTTPNDTTGGLRGIIRRWLIETGRVVPDNDGVLRKDRVQNGEMVLVFNGVEGCRLAIVRLRR
ncbi:hypothetical protein BV25DRAFT_1820574 [Artomyces pyxidatus]|uniref:Uncharacterized protein n=1 Tax=Artomyces pyxidatus TaxID=48021 RepID=A0ACB8TDS4_9AGAM|nr:hypothetical protein BV25DRAFT_1820574 [Artomyces pyxidatus]